MEKYIAFLRGINVSGKNKIAMPMLKSAFETAGFSAVKTYINSGNVLFTSEIQEINQLIKKCEVLITEAFELTIPVAVVAVAELNVTIKHAPSWWNQAEETIHYAIIMIPPLTTAEVFAAVGEIKPEYEQIACYGELIFWSAPRKTFNQARWSKIASSSVNKQVTIRNANTINKLLQMSQ
ncbi:DUF1697 domain-containing protein [Enterococcus pseudoavium]|uniref:DUF1697 domain-containing protein n=1 Tax=Enterococcus pseudoavium TaxID=44007 RepID=UPI00082A6AE0|nr:DUF1697 domain-containing protein [Enterococcus pseudoavium]